MQTDVVTGAFGYSGAAIARELRAAGHQVRTLTGHPRAQTDRDRPGGATSTRGRSTSATPRRSSTT